jgi:NitT/TauT family transport system substrate-binding protein
MHQGASGSDRFEIRFSPKWHPQAQFAGIYMAIEKGIYDQYGLDVILAEPFSSEEALTKLDLGEIDIGHFDLSQAILANRDSSHIVNIGQISQKNSVMLVGKRSRGISSIRDFNNKKLGIWRRTSHIVTEAFIKENSINIQQIPIDWSVNIFIQDAVDVINVMRYNEYYQLLQAGFSEEELFIVDLCDWDLDIPDEGFYVRPAFFREHPEVCRSFLQATIDGWLYAFSHPDEAVDLVLRIMQDANIRANRAHQSWMLEKMKDIVMPSASEIGILKREDFDKALDLSVKYSNLDRKISFEEFYPYAAD